MRNRLFPKLVACLCTVAILGPAAMPSCLASETEVRDIGDRLELFVDREMIDSLKGARLVMHPPRPAEIALTFDAPWEGNQSVCNSVIRDGDLFRMYYRGWPNPDGGKQPSNDPNQVLCYAESPDGIHWTKPCLGLFEHDGSKDNNIVWKSTDRPAHAFSPFLDTKPGIPVDERYKAVVYGQIPGRKKPCLYAYASADGLRWRQLFEEPIITEGAFDSQNVVYWDPRRGKYVSYYRIWIENNSRRTIAVATSDDFRHWSPTKQVEIGQMPEEHFYTNATAPYFRAPHYAFMFPKRLVVDRQLIKGHPRVGISDGVFLSSRDGEHFDRTFREALIRPGLDRENWGDRSNRVAWSLLQTGPDEMSVYYSQHFRFPSSHMVRGTWRLDGIASIRAGYEPGEMVTKPFAFSGKELVLNYSTSAAGSVRVEIQDATGQPLPGFALEDAPELFGDEIARGYAWKAGNDVSSLARKPVRLRFVLKDADLYSYRFAD